MCVMPGSSEPCCLCVPCLVQVSHVLSACVMSASRESCLFVCVMQGRDHWGRGDMSPPEFKMRGTPG